MANELHAYNIFAQTLTEVESFDNDSIVIAEVQQEGTARYASRKNNNSYRFSQRKMLNLIDLYDNSKFETGPLDSEGQRKLFLNIGTFRRKVASKQIRIGLKDYLFIPDDYFSIWLNWFMQRQFKIWSRYNGMAELINEFEEMFPKYGTIVSKRCGEKVERVPLRSLRNTQDAKSLKHAAMTGGFVIEEHAYTTNELQAYPDWKTGDLKLNPGQKLQVFERYAMVPKSVIYAFEGLKDFSKEEGEQEVLSMAILSPKRINKDHVSGNLLYIQELAEEDWPYEEEHWDRQDGRWLGVGEIENQMENQIARNTNTNLRRRALYWASKKVFQSSDEAVQRNLVKHVRDGDVMHVAPNGNISQVDMGTRALGDMAAEDKIWEDNSNQKSFTFEAATGESMPSGTPFRLGVMLSDAVSTHFNQMKEKYGLFLIRSYFNQMIPIFKKQTKEHVITIGCNEEGAQHVIEAITDHYVWEEFKKKLLAGEIPNPEEMRQKATEYMMRQKYHFVKMPAKAYDEVRNHMELDLTGQAIDTKQQIETITNIYLAAAKAARPDGTNGVLDDPRLMRLLEMAVSKTGMTLRDFMGPIKSAPPARPAIMPGPGPMPPMPNETQPPGGPALPAA